MFRNAWPLWDRFGLSDEKLLGRWWALAATVGMVLVISVLYLASNYLAAARGVTAWRPSEMFVFDGQQLDRALPVWAWSILIYNTLTLFFFVPWLSYPRTLEGARQFKVLMQAQIMANAVAVPIFLLLPSPVDMRDQVLAKMADVPTWLHASYLWTYAVDTHYNSWPCLHVAQPMLVVLAARHWISSRWVEAGLWMWWVVLSLSVLTTKQHFVWDILTGCVLAMALYVLMLRPSFDVAVVGRGDG